jgi:hypothetical protein
METSVESAGSSGRSDSSEKLRPEIVPNVAINILLEVFETVERVPYSKQSVMGTDLYDRSSQKTWFVRGNTRAYQVKYHVYPWFDRDRKGKWHPVHNHADIYAAVDYYDVYLIPMDVLPDLMRQHKLFPFRGDNCKGIKLWYTDLKKAAEKGLIKIVPHNRWPGAPERKRRRRGTPRI